MAMIVFLVVLALVFAVVWINLAKKPGPRAKLGPDGTNVREPETFVVHHEGKAQGLDIANTALKERTEDLRKDLPGDTHKIQTPIPGRDMIRMDAPPSDISKFGSEKVAPGAEPKEKVLTEGPIGSRPGTPEEPGSPYAKGRRVTDVHRDMELAAETLPNLEPGRKGGVERKLAVSPSTTGKEPGYGLGKTGPGDTDGESDEPGDGFHEQPEATDELPDMPEGDMPTASVERGRVVPFTKKATGTQPKPPAREARFQPESSMANVEFRPDPTLAQEASEELAWSGLQEDLPIPEVYGEDNMVAMVRNPRSLYVYWERSGYGDENLRSMLGADYERSTPCLRVFDVTSGAHPGQPGGQSFTITVGEHDDHWFVNDGIQPGHRYVVSYERRTTDGQFFLISHSAPVTTPHETAAEPANPIQQRYGGQPGPTSGSIWR